MHTTTLPEMDIEQCNFCGAFRSTKENEPIKHHDGCCVPQGDEAIAKEQAIIDHISNAQHDD